MTSPTPTNPQAALADTIAKMNDQFHTAVERSANLHRNGAHDDAVLTETVVAVTTAKALEFLTGVSWDERLQAAGPDPE